jgi:chloramphenicol-sensitive protein RarD
VRALRLLAGAERADLWFAGHDLTTTALLVAAGALTALPLLAFAAATQRLDLATVGMLMYINPTLQFVTAIWLFGEPMQVAQLRQLRPDLAGVFLERVAEVPVPAFSWERASSRLHQA